eukprot:54962_1
MTVTTNLVEKKETKVIYMELAFELVLPIIQLKIAKYDTNKRIIIFKFDIDIVKRQNIYVDIDFVKHLQIYVQCLSCTDDKKIIHEESIPYHNWHKMKDSEYGMYLKKQFPASIGVAVKGKKK